MFPRDHCQALFGSILLVYEAGRRRAFLGDPLWASGSTVALEAGYQLLG